jgi:hypothetical protein
MTRQLFLHSMIARKVQHEKTVEIAHVGQETGNKTARTEQ